MAVIINDFEIMVEPPTGQAGAQANPPPRSNEPGQKPPVLQPHDIERITRHFKERRCRLVAD